MPYILAVTLAFVLFLSGAAQAQLDCVDMKCTSEYGGRYLASVVSPTERAETIEKTIMSYQREIDRLNLNMKILDCPLMVALSVGTARGASSYTGHCNLDIGGEKWSGLLCNNTHVDHFAMKLRFFAISPDALAEFAFDNCFGG